MPIPIEELQVLISANSDQFKNALLGIQGQLKGLDNAVNKISNNAGNNMFGSFLKANVATQLITSAVRGLVGELENLGQSVVTDGSKYAELAIVTDTVARNMGIGDDRISELRKTLRGLNIDVGASEEIIKTLSLSGLATLSSKVQSVDASTGQLVHGTDALIVTMNDLSAAAGISASDGMDRITKFIRLGRIQAVDGIIDIGKLNNAYLSYANGLGKTVQELSAQELEQLRVNVVLEEGQKAFGAFANTMQRSETVWQFVQAQAENIIQILGRDLEPIFAALGSGLLSLLSGIAGGVSSSEDVIRNWANHVAGYIVALIRIIGTLLSRIPGIGQNFNGMANFTIKATHATNALHDGMANLARSTDGAAGKAAKLKKELAGLAGFDEMNVLKQSSDSGAAGAGAGATLGNINPSGVGGLDLKDSSADINNFATKAEQDLKSFFDSINTFLKPIIDWFNENISPIFAKVGDVINQLVSIAVSKFPAFMNAIKPLTDALSPILQEIANNFLWIVSIILDNIGPAFSILADIAIFVIGNLSSIVAFILNTWDPAARLLWSVIKFAVEGIINLIKAIPGALNGLGGMISGVWNNIVGWTTTAWANIKNAVGGVINWFNGIPGTFTMIGNKIGNVWNGIKSGAVGIWEGIKTTFKNGINAVIDLVNNFIRGLNVMFKTAGDVFALLPGGPKINIGLSPIPKLAQGGIVSSPTIAMLGEAGKEAVIPLNDNNNGLASLISEQINKGSDGRPVRLVINVGGTKLLDKMVDLAKDRSIATNELLFNL